MNNFYFVLGSSRIAELVQVCRQNKQEPLAPPAGLSLISIRLIYISCLAVHSRDSRIEMYHLRSALQNSLLRCSRVEGLSRAACRPVSQPQAVDGTGSRIHTLLINT